MGSSLPPSTADYLPPTPSIPTKHFGLIFTAMMHHSSEYGILVCMNMEKIEFPAIPNVKDFKSHKEWEAGAWNELVEWLAQYDLKTLKRVLESIMSRPERRHMVKRAAAMARFRNGASYRMIGRELF